MRRISNYGPSLIVLATTVTVLLAGPPAVKRIAFAHTRATIIEASQRLEDSNILEQMNQAYRDIATVVEPSVVHISAEHIVQDRFGNQARKGSSGSGWIFDGKGHIVTNEHVVEEALRIEVQLHNGEIHEAEIIGRDTSTDIAVLRIDTDRIQPATLRDLEEGPVRQGDMVFAFGSPFDFRFSMSSGVVSGKGRAPGVIRNQQGQLTGYENFIQVDAAINPGNSGGPLTDFRGRVIGMNTAIATGRRGAGAFEEGQFAGIGLAIPVEMIEPVVTQLITSGRVSKGFLGLNVVDRTNSVRDELQVLGFQGVGLLVTRIDDESPLGEAGLLQSGDIITRFNGRRASTTSQFFAWARRLRSGESVELSVWRFNADLDAGRERDVRVPGTVSESLASLRLVQGDQEIGDVLEQLGFKGRGIRVARLEPDGPAQASGLRRHDIITHINRTRINTVQQLRSTISSMLPGDVAKVRAWRFDEQSGEGEEVMLDVTLARLNPLRYSGSLPPDQSRDQIVELGIERMSTATRELAGEYQVEYHPGVIIEELVEGSSISVRLPRGSIIVEVMENPIGNVDELIDALAEHDVRGPFGVAITVVLPDGTVAKRYLKVRER